MLLFQALRYPFQGQGNFRRIVMLSLLQLLPILGQLILLGYGFDIVRAVYAQQKSLPSIRLLPALGNGVRFIFTGLVYLLPILITIALTGVGSFSSGKSSSSLNVFALALSIGITTILFLGGILAGFVRTKRTGSSSVQRPRTRGEALRSMLGGLVLIIGTVLLTILVSSSGITSGKPNGLSIIVFVLLALVLLLIGFVLYIGGVRTATEHKGLFAPLTNAKILLQDRAATGRLVLNVVLLGIITFLATGTGLLLFVLPGLLVFVICSLALWYLFASFCLAMGVQKPASPITNPDPVPSR